VDETNQPEHWSCEPTGDSDPLTQQPIKQCELIIPAKRIQPVPEGADIVFFGSSGQFVGVRGHCVS
jgi:hypothetical protein